jgi:predicted MFS family arabinose efflux permease
MVAGRWGVSSVFFVAGGVIATWASYIPLVQQRLAIGDGELGRALFAMAAGALCAVAAAGALIERFSSRAMTATAGAAFCLLLPAPIFAPSLLSLTAALLVFGFAFGLMDVAMNAQAANVQRRAGRSLMSGFHGLYSLGGLAGSAAAGLLLWLQTPALGHVAGVAATMAVLLGLGCPRLLPGERGETHGAPALSLPPRCLASLASLGFLIFVGEGAVMDWANVYLANVLNAGADRAVAGFAAFSLTMAAGRFLGDWGTERLGSRRFAVGSAALAAAGLGLALARPGFEAAVAGFGLAGLGLANLIPMLFSQAAEATPDTPQRGIAGVAGVGYFGLVAGPPAIGFAADAIGLRGALGLIAGALALVALLLPSALQAAAGPRN